MHAPPPRGQQRRGCHTNNTPPPPPFFLHTHSSSSSSSSSSAAAPAAAGAIQHTQHVLPDGASLELLRLPGVLRVRLCLLLFFSARKSGSDGASSKTLTPTNHQQTHSSPLPRPPAAAQRC